MICVEVTLVVWLVNDWKAVELMHVEELLDDGGGGGGGGGSDELVLELLGCDVVVESVGVGVGVGVCVDVCVGC